MPVIGARRGGPPRRVEDPAELQVLLGRHPRVHVYGLGDLAPRFWSRSTWWRRGEAALGRVGLGPGLGETLYAVSVLDPGGVVALAAELARELPRRCTVTGPPGLSAVLTPTHRVLWRRPHVKMALVDPPAIPGRHAVRRLTSADVTELRRLYELDAAAASSFADHMVADGLYLGVEAAGGALLAAAGTHVLDDERGVAAIANVATAPDARRRGLATEVVAVLATHLAERVPVVGLNVAADDLRARGLYARLGFRDVHAYEEAALA